MLPIHSTPTSEKLFSFSFKTSITLWSPIIVIVFAVSITGVKAVLYINHAVLFNATWSYYLTLKWVTVVFKLIQQSMNITHNAVILHVHWMVTLVNMSFMLEFRRWRYLCMQLKTFSWPNSGCASQPLHLLTQYTCSFFISRIAEKSGQICQHELHADFMYELLSISVPHPKAELGTNSQKYFPNWETHLSRLSCSP